jgi:DNA-binding NarL/FixJ family response regulator
VEVEAPIRVVVADDSFLTREAVTAVLADAAEIDLVASVSDAGTLMATIDEQQPEVVVTDIRMPPTNKDEGIAVAATLRETHPAIGVVILSGYGDPEYVLRLLDHGSNGRAYLLKEHVQHKGQLIQAVKAVHVNDSFIDAKLVETLVAGRSRAMHSPLLELTPRELETLAQIAEGKSNEAIAKSLFLTKRAVEKHINSIFMKLNLAEAPDVSRRVKAALMFLADAHVAGLAQRDK